MKQQASLSLDDARRVIEAAERKATEIGQPMNVAVVDAGGNLVAHANDTTRSPGDPGIRSGCAPTQTQSLRGDSGSCPPRGGCDEYDDTDPPTRRQSHRRCVRRHSRTVWLGRQYGPAAVRPFLPATRATVRGLPRAVGPDAQAAALTSMPGSPTGRPLKSLASPGARILSSAGQSCCAAQYPG